MSCFNNLCRLCAGKVDGLVSLNIFALDQEDLYKKISTCLPIKVSLRSFTINYNITYYYLSKIIADQTFRSMNFIGGLLEYHSYQQCLTRMSGGYC